MLKCVVEKNIVHSFRFYKILTIWLFKSNFVLSYNLHYYNLMKNVYF